MRYLLYMKLLDTIKDIICESSKFNGTVTHDHRNRRVDMSSEAMKWKDKSPTYRQSATMEDIELEEVVEDMKVYHPDFLPEGHHDLDEDLENWSYDGDTIGIEKDLDEYVNKELYKTLKLNKGGEFNEVEDLDEYRFDFYEEDKKDCPKGMYYCSDDNICKPDSQRLKEQEEKGHYTNPIDSSDDNDVPSESFKASLYADGKEWHKERITKKSFLQGVKLLVNSHGKSWFNDHSSTTDDPWYRQEEVWDVVKVIGFNKNSSGLLDKLFWAAYDNFDFIKNNTVTNYDELDLRPLMKFEVPMEGTASVYKIFNWTPLVYAYDGNDAEMAVINDEDGAYEPWEWDGLDTYREEEVDWQQGEANDIAGEITAKIVFPAQTGNRTSSGLTFGDGSDD